MFSAMWHVALDLHHAGTMVDSPKSNMALPENIDARFERVESKLDDLQRAVDQGAVRVDQAFADYRLFAEFLFERLRTEMHEGFRQVGGRFEQVHRRFRQIDQHFELITGRFEQMDRRFEQMDGRFEQMDGRFEQTGGQLERLERKMDWLIEFVTNGRS